MSPDHHGHIDACDTVHLRFQAQAGSFGECQARSTACPGKEWSPRWLRGHQRPAEDSQSRGITKAQEASPQCKHNLRSCHPPSCGTASANQTSGASDCITRRPVQRFTNIGKPDSDCDHPPLFTHPATKGYITMLTPADVPSDGRSV